MLAKLTSKQVTEWEQFYRLRPFGFVRESILFGTLAAQQHNLNTTSRRPKQWNDFFPAVMQRKDADGKDSPERIIALMKEYNLSRGYDAYGRRVSR